MTFLLAVLAVLSIWDYPARQMSHQKFRAQFAQALRAGDASAMEKACRGGVELLPDDPTWHYNLACALARGGRKGDEAFDELEKAIDLGFRNADAIAKDPDFSKVATHLRFLSLVEYAREMKSRPLLFGPMATVDATGPFGQSVALGEQNLGWDFDLGAFVAHMSLGPEGKGGNAGDLYMNRDGGHSPLDVASFPGLTVVKLDRTGHERGMDLDLPNMVFPYPVFGNCSRAYVHPQMWRSLSRALMTTEAVALGRMVKFYLSNQVWVFPSNADTAPIGTSGDVFASITPYWLTTAGRSFSDVPYLRMALEASRSLDPAVKREIVRRGHLAPTVLTLIRKSLKGVTDEAGYLSPTAHPTAFPADGVDVARLKASAAALTTDSIPPLVPIKVRVSHGKLPGKMPELTFATPFAWALVWRAEEQRRDFSIVAHGADEYAFVQTHGAGVDVRIEANGAEAKVTVDRNGLSPTNRVDITVVGRNKGTGWGAPSYLSIARMDESAPYSDPILTPRPAK